MSLPQAVLILAALDGQADAILRVTSDPKIKAACLATGGPEGADYEKALRKQGALAYWAAAGTKDPQLVERCEKETDPSIFLKRGLARSPYTTPTRLAELARDKNDTVALVAMFNPNTPEAEVAARLKNLPTAGLDAERACLAGTVMRNHPSLTPWFAAHKNPTYRRLAARMPGLDETSLRAAFERTSIAGGNALLTNPLLPAGTWRPTWWRGSDARDTAARLINPDGELKNPGDWKEASRATSQTLDIAIAKAAGNLTKDEAIAALRAWPNEPAAKDTLNQT